MYYWSPCAQNSPRQDKNGYTLGILKWTVNVCGNFPYMIFRKRSSRMDWASDTRIVQTSFLKPDPAGFKE